MSVNDRFRNEHACQAVAREFRLFHVLTERLADDSPQRDDRSLLDSFLLHTRVLRDFFFHEGHRSEDLVAAQFVPNWKLIRPPTTRYLFSHKQRLDQSLGRLTVQQRKWAGSMWDIAAIQREIGQLIELFRANLAPELVDRFHQAELTLDEDSTSQGTSP